MADFDFLNSIIQQENEYQAEKLTVPISTSFLSMNEINRKSASLHQSNQNSVNGLQTAIGFEFSKTPEQEMKSQYY